jgi:translocation and assembly module TamB
MVFQRTWVRVLIALAVLLLVAVIAAWAARKPIAREVIDRNLAQRGVRASYDIVAIGTRHQRIEHIRLGDPEHPDLTAEWAEIDVGPTLSSLNIKAVRAGGVRLKGKLVEGTLSLGEVDKLLPKPTGEPFTFPDLDLMLSDARMRLDTPYGPLGARLDGRGNLASDFGGKIAVAAPAIAQPGCSAQGATLYGDLRIKVRQPAFSGPVRAQRIDCSGARLTQANVMLDATLDQAFDRWSGGATFDLASAAGRGVGARNLKGSLDFDGAKASTRGNLSLAMADVNAPSVATRTAHIGGTFDLAQDANGKTAIEMSGALDAAGLVPDRHLLAQMTGLGSRTAGTPVAPFGDALSRAFGGLSRGSNVSARYSLVQNGAQGRMTLSAVNASSSSGAKLVMQGEAPVIVRWPGGLALAGRAQLSGGGFPTSDIRFDGPGGVAQIAPLAAAGSKLALAPVRFSFADGLRLDTVATLDGPLGPGRVTGLRVPFALGAGKSPLTGCIPAAFQSLDLAGLKLAPGQLTACISGNEARISSPRLNGRLGSSPIQLAAKGARVGLSRGDFSVDALAVRLGDRAHLSLLDVGLLTGTISSGGAGGRFTDTSGRIANVPLLLTQAAGNWKLDRGVFTLGGGLQVADAAAEPHFLPMVSDNVALRFANGKIMATGTAREPKTQTAVTNVTITHDLARGVGGAVLDVPGLTFGPQFQPEALTYITLGVIANVQGTLAGRGDLRWTPKGVTSTGGFSTDRLDLAAAFGPVTGMKGQIMLSDLLGLETGPGQRVSIALINPGIAVTDGEIGYQLLPGLKTRIEGGRWPFAGGFLVLEPTTLDLSESAERRLTFRVEGLDAARFIAAMEFQNISATGLFDGNLPMVFDKNGGRIEGGKLVARGGGTLAYVGEISNENIGTMGRFAFDALKAIKYDRLSIDMNGAIDGDVITRISFAGVNQAPISGVRTKLPIKVIGLTNIPFIFNVTITAKFRQLFEMTRSFNDPSILIQRMIPQLQTPQQPKPADLPKPDKPVQQ